MADADPGRRGSWQAWILMGVDSGRRGVYLLSVSLRRSCCNWASPVTKRIL
jgi:hypothetical protein